jgi:hypothetical protein
LLLDLHNALTCGSGEILKVNYLATWMITSIVATQHLHSCIVLAFKSLLSIFSPHRLTFSLFGFLSAACLRCFLCLALGASCRSLDNRGSSMSLLQSHRCDYLLYTGHARIPSAGRSMRCGQATTKRSVPYAAFSFDLFIIWKRIARPFHVKDHIGAVLTCKSSK